MAYYLKDLPFTEEGKKLNLSDEDRKRFRLVYKKDGEDWILHDIFEEGNEYGDDCIVVPLESTYRNCTTFPAGQIFANVQGSDGDSNPVGKSISWIDFWRCMFLAKTNSTPPNNCCTDGAVYYIYDGREAVERYCTCTGGNGYVLCGGHVIKGQASYQPNAGATVYIVPICGSHNGIALGRYMKTRNWTFAVEMWYRLPLQNYLAQHPLESHEKI